MKKLFLGILLFVGVLSFGAKAEASEIYRLYNPNSGEHFYTGKLAEADSLATTGWSYEGIGWIAPDKSDTPIYRLYNKNEGDHHYTANPFEKDFLVKKGWNDEGISFYASKSGTPIYRQYNPNAKAGAHNFTGSMSENNFLITKGWNAEGIAFYVSSLVPADQKIVFDFAGASDGGAKFEENKLTLKVGQVVIFQGTYTGLGFADTLTPVSSDTSIISEASDTEARKLGDRGALFYDHLTSPVPFETKVMAARKTGTCTLTLTSRYGAVTKVSVTVTK